MTMYFLISWELLLLRVNFINYICCIAINIQPITQSILDNARNVCDFDVSDNLWGEWGWNQHVFTLGNYIYYTKVEIFSRFCFFWSISFPEVDAAKFWVSSEVLQETSQQCVQVSFLTSSWACCFMGEKALNWDKSLVLMGNLRPQA